MLDALRAGADRSGLLLDFDGTLAPIVARAEDAQVSEEVPALLNRAR